MIRADLEDRFHEAVQSYWNTREEQKRRQKESGKNDAGTRGSVTGGGQMAALEQLVVDILKHTGLKHPHIRTKKELNASRLLPPREKMGSFSSIE